jgi:pimeloyl-ACP methyl ester carboxylesterase
MNIKINGFSIDYLLEGPRTGIPVVFIHAFPMSKEMWKPQVDVLKKEYRVLSYDVRGHGLSEVGDGQYTIEYCVDDLICLLDYLKLEQVVVVGISMGGYIALRAIERNPNRFKGAVLCDTRSEADSNETKIKRATDAKTVKLLGMRRFAEYFIPKVFHENTLATNPKVVKFAKCIMENNSPTGITGMLIALAARTDTTPSLEKIQIPTLLLMGQFDELTPPSVMTPLQEKIPGVIMHMIPNAAHFCNLENPAEFNAALIQFLEHIS